jgi:hypothetical protein
MELKEGVKNIVVAKIKKVVKQLNKASKLHKRQSDIVKQHIKKMTGNKKKS